ncbi:MAG TPA: hypothetical protein VIF62_31620 [Labilithrix sp.]
MRFAFAAIAAALVACGGAPPPKAVESGPLVVAPARPAPTPPAATPPARPREIAAWAHVDDVDGVLDFLGAGALAQSPWGGGFQSILELVDTRQPLDVAWVTDEKDGAPVVRVALRDTHAAIERMRVAFDVTEEGRRVHVKRKQHEGDDTFTCDFGSTRGPDVAICGSPHAFDRAVDWLQTAPLPSPDESARSGSAQPMVRAVVYGSAFARELAPGDDKALASMVGDLQNVSAELDREDPGIAFAVTARFSSVASKISAQIFEPANAEPPNDAFRRVWKDTSAAVFFAGGGAAPAWAEQLLGKDDASAKRKAAAATLARAFQKPVVAGYGVRADRARAAIAAVRSAKDPEKAMRALEKALEAYSIVGGAIDVATAQSAMKDLAADWNAEETDAKVKKPPRWSIRAAPPALGLPRGSFFLDDRKAKADASPTLFFPDGATTWAVDGADDVACADAAKKLAAAKPSAADDALFARKGAVMSGYLSSIVGAFAMHRLTLGTGAPAPSALADIERDLAAPRLPLPFVLTTERQGDGGVARFEIHGERAAYQMLGEHVGGVLGSGLAMLVAFAAIGLLTP